MCTHCGCARPVNDGAAAHPGDGGAHRHGHDAHDALPAPTHAHAQDVEVFDRLLKANDAEAAHNRAHFDEHGVLAINLMSSPGAGKTRLLESTIDAIAGRWRIAVIEGDLETENDAERIRAKGVPAVQITTGTACHLDAHMVHHALHAMDLSDVDILFIENVGNLVCPASFDLGQHANVTLLSVTEGDDKPSKYPVMFRASDLMVLSKCDLLPVLDDFDPDAAAANLRALASAAPVLRLSAKQPQSLHGWIEWLAAQKDAQRWRLAAASAVPAREPDAATAHAHGHGHGHGHSHGHSHGRSHAHGDDLAAAGAGAHAHDHAHVQVRP